ncbi:MAG: hypothetical protein V3S98_04050 [Dehalococcoidia bacterium]
MPTLRESLLWLRPIPHWTLAVTVAVGALTLVLAIGVLLDVTSVRRPPGGVLAEFYMTAQARDYEAARDFLSRDAKAEAAALTPREWEALLDGFTNGATLSEVTVVGVRNFGSHSVAGAVLDFTDTDSKTRVELLVKEGRRWRLEWPIGTRGFQETVKQFE